MNATIVAHIGLSLLSFWIALNSTGQSVFFWGAISVIWAGLATNLLAIARRSSNG